jgi:hypothetical protein
VEKLVFMKKAQRRVQKIIAGIKNLQPLAPVLCNHRPAFFWLERGDSHTNTDMLFANCESSGCSNKIISPSFLSILERFTEELQLLRLNGAYLPKYAMEPC